MAIYAFRNWQLDPHPIEALASHYGCPVRIVGRVPPAEKILDDIAELCSETVYWEVRLGLEDQPNR